MGITEVVEEGKEENTESQEELNFSQREAIFIPKYQDALNNGLAVLQQSLLMKDEFDFDNEPKDEYSKFPLPFVIGTKQFKEEDYCGLYVPLDENIEDFEELDEEEGLKNESKKENQDEKDTFSEFEEEDDEYDQYSEDDSEKEKEPKHKDEKKENYEDEFMMKILQKL